MIEFKAECGHTVRARDEDAGGVIRCSYCGRNAKVPDNLDSDLDFLFRDLDQSAQPVAEQRRGGWFRKRGKPLSRKGRTRGAFDPFALVLKLCYAALLIVIVVVVARKWVFPLVQGEGSVPWVNARGKEALPAERRTDPATQPRSPRFGLIRKQKPKGLYVASTPSGAMAYYVEESKAPPRGRIIEVAGVQQLRTDGECPRVPDGTYVVEIAFPWNDPRLNHYPEYWNFRRSVEHASDQQRRKLLEEYLVPDEAIDAFIAQTEEQIYLVRQYRATVRRGRFIGVQSLFLPKILKGEGPSFSIELLVNNHLPTKRAYEFDENHVRDELAYYGVPESDRRFVVEALARVGVIPYVTPDGRTRLFKIGMDGGIFATKIIREISQ